MADGMPNIEIPDLRKSKYLLPIKVRFAWHLIRKWHSEMEKYDDDPIYVNAVECIADYFKSSDSSEAIKSSW